MFIWIFNVNYWPHLLLNETTVLFNAKTIITIVCICLYVHQKWNRPKGKCQVSFILFYSLLRSPKVLVLLTLWPGGWCQICFYLVNINTVSWRKFWCLIGLAAEYIYLPRQRQRRLPWKIAFLLSGQIHVELGK